MDLARVTPVQVVLRKLGRGSRAVAGRLVRAPRKGSVVVIEFSDGMHEYVTTPVKRVLRVAARDVFYIETVNSRYRLRSSRSRARPRRRLQRLTSPPIPLALPAKRSTRARVMGKFDSRASVKMTRRKAQREEEARLARKADATQGYAQGRRQAEPQEGRCSQRELLAPGRRRRDGYSVTAAPSSWMVRVANCLSGPGGTASGIGSPSKPTSPDRRFSRTRCQPASSFQCCSTRVARMVPSLLRTQA